VEIVMVWSMLMWNEPRLFDMEHARLPVSTTDNSYASEDECLRNARSIIERLPKARIACVATQLAKAELSEMKKYEKLIKDNLPELPNAPKP